MTVMTVTAEGASIRRLRHDVAVLERTIGAAQSAGAQHRAVAHAAILAPAAKLVGNAPVSLAIAPLFSAIQLT
jgi:hypothetical protein